MRKGKQAFLAACTGLLFAIGVLIYGVLVLEQSPHIPLIFSTVVIMLYGIMNGNTWQEMRIGMIESISESIEAILIICLIGVTIGTWMAGGTVPAIIYYGLQVFSPRFFLVSVVVLCSVMSLVTGSSWTTIGTIGVAFMGISAGLGIPAGMTAGAVICGAYFGDKQSPLSDSTNFAAAVAKTDLYEHTRSMIYTTGPAYLMSLAIFLILGLKYGGQSTDISQIQAITAGLKDGFYMGPVLLLPLLLLLILIIRKFPAIPTMIIASALGLVCAVFIQGENMEEGMHYMYSGYTGTTGIEAVDTLLTRGGLTSMTGTVTLMLMSLSLAGVMRTTGIMNVILERTGKLTENSIGLIIVTWVLTFLLSFFAADPYLAMILPANILGTKYDELGIQRSVMSRTLEDGGTIVCPMVPWGTNGIYCAQTLGVSVGTYISYYFLGMMTPVVMLFCAVTSVGVRKKGNVDGYTRKGQNDPGKN